MTSRPVSNKQLSPTVIAALGTSRPRRATPAHRLRGAKLCYDLTVNVGLAHQYSELRRRALALSRWSDDSLRRGTCEQRPGQADEEIYIATREATSEPFGPRQNLDPRVTCLGFGDYSPELSHDGLTLYFSSQLARWAGTG
jgi:hypothetical protein